MKASQTLIDRAAEVGLTRYRIAKETGLSQGALSEIANGRRPMPPHAAAQIAALLGADPNEAALAAVIDQAKPEKRAELSRLFKLAAAPISALAVAASALALLLPSSDAQARTGAVLEGSVYYVK